MMSKVSACSVQGLYLHFYFHGHDFQWHSLLGLFCFTSLVAGLHASFEETVQAPLLELVVLLPHLLHRHTVLYTVTQVGSHPLFDKCVKHMEN